ncbi:MAG: hypothetical protein ACI4SF_02900 [Oscillospiraceae bacterium]
MEFNSENYKRSLENIKASEKFLAETKRLMLEEAEKKPSRKPHLIKITSFAAAAACIAIIAVIGSNLTDSKDIETAVTEQTVPYITETSATAQTEPEAAEEEPVTVPALEDNTEEIADEAADLDEPEVKLSNIPEENTYAEETTSSAVSEPPADDATPAPFAVNAFLNDTFEDEADEGEAEGSGNNGTPYENLNSSSEEDTADSDDDIETDDDCPEPSTDDGEDVPIAPAFTKIKGGKAADFPEFSPSDTEKLCEFLSLVSQDDINAEVSVPKQKTEDLFGEKALAINAVLLQAAESLTPCENADFEPELTFSIFDNQNGTLLYTVQIDDEIIAVSVKHGKTVYFEAGEEVAEAVLLAAK